MASNELMQRSESVSIFEIYESNQSQLNITHYIWSPVHLRRDNK